MHSLTLVDEYNVSKFGFLPPQSPLKRLPSPAYDPWEAIVSGLPALLENRQLRGRVDEMPCISAACLEKDAERQRAYVVLAFLVHGYVWQGPLPAQRLPPCLTIPFLEVSSALSLPPVATYAALVLWNWARGDSGADMSEPLNLKAIQTFTGTRDEEWFYMVSVATESYGAELVRLLMNAMNHASLGNAGELVPALDEFATKLDELSRLVHRMHDHCDPYVFYYRIRPLLAGSENMEAVGLPHGVFYDEGNGKGRWRKYRGGSNAQSSLIQFFDIALGVEHDRSIGFHKEMRGYMPGSHAAFLNDAQAKFSLRDFVTRNASNANLADAFNRAVKSLTRFRETHLQLVARYIILPSKKVAEQRRSTRLDLAAASSKSISDNTDAAELTGTGGTKLVPFLKRTKLDTHRAAVGAV